MPAASESCHKLLALFGNSQLRPVTPYAADQSDHAAVASGYLDLGVANAVTKIGYIGSKQYVRLTVTPASNTSTALAAVAKLGNPSVRPAP